MHNNSIIFNELKELNSILVTIPRINVYTVPHGYFDTLSHDVLHSLIPGRPSMNVQPSLNSDVPEGYFDGLAASILNRIKNDSSADESSTLLEPWRSVNPYRVPRGYFDGLADQLMATVSTGTATESSPVLDAVRHINPYRVPQGYFDTLSTVINSKLMEPAKVVIMRKRSTFFNYAAAAVITGLLGLSVISVVDNRQQVQVVPVTASAELNFDEALSGVSDENIVAYLKQSGEDVNAALVASVAEDKNLPEQVDYLTDDKTLDNILQGLDVHTPSKTN